MSEHRLIVALVLGDGMDQAPEFADQPLAERCAIRPQAAGQDDTLAPARRPASLIRPLGSVGGSGARSAVPAGLLEAFGDTVCDDYATQARFMLEERT